MKKRYLVLSIIALGLTSMVSAADPVPVDKEKLKAWPPGEIAGRVRDTNTNFVQEAGLPLYTNATGHLQFDIKDTALDPRRLKVKEWISQSHTNNRGNKVIQVKGGVFLVYSKGGAHFEGLARGLVGDQIAVDVQATGQNMDGMVDLLNKIDFSSLAALVKKNP